MRRTATIPIRKVIIPLTCVVLGSALSSVSADCYKKINNIINDQFGKTDDSESRVYKLCDNNNFGGTKPLLIFRPNVSVKCGSDGNSTNECTFNQGLDGQQVIVGSPQDIYESFIFTEFSESNSFRKDFETAMDGMSETQKTQTISNIELKGITFTKHSKNKKAKKQTEPNVQIISPASVMMEDCVLRDNLYRPFLVSAMGKPSDASTEGTIQLDILDSTFQNNSPGDDVAFPGDYGTYNETRKYSGLIIGSDVGSITTDVRVVSTVFQGNSYIKEDKDLAENGSFLVGTGLGSLTIKNSCFLQNSASLGLIASQLGDVTGGLNMQLASDDACGGFSHVDPDDPNSGITATTLETLCTPFNSTTSCMAFEDTDETFEELLAGDDDYAYSYSDETTDNEEVSMFLKIAGPVVVFALGFLIGILLGAVMRCLCQNSQCGSSSRCCNRNPNNMAYPGY